MASTRRWIDGLSIILASSLCAFTAGATPEVPIDDWIYQDLYRLQDQGDIPVSAVSGNRLLTESMIRSLFVASRTQTHLQLIDAESKGFWMRPAERVTTRLSLASDIARSYSVPARPRNMLGESELACEYQEGRPCGDGAHGLLEMDSSAGYGRWLSAFSRIQAQATGNDRVSAGATIDRLYASLEFGPAELLLGRNTVLMGPGRHTQLLWSANPAPIDQLQLSIRGLVVPMLPIRVGGTYIFGRLDSPQRFTNTLVSLARVYVELADRVNLGMTNLLILGGKGAPNVGPWQFVEEHVHRTGPWPGEGVSDRRLGLDMTVGVPSLRSTFYTEIVFEDSRAQLVNALAHDVDYLLGWAASGLGRSKNHGFLIELVRTGVRSEEHGVFSSGMTSGARVLGSPLGPDATSLYVSPRWDIRQNHLSIAPWCEWVRTGSDTFFFPENAGISRATSGLAEFRTRAGLDAIARIEPDLWLRTGAFFEHVDNEAFQVATRNNAGLSLSVVWQNNGTAGIR